MTQEEYVELYKKMQNDKDFNETLKTAKSGREIYDIYTKFGYTDLSYEEFSKTCKEKITALAEHYQKQNPSDAEKLSTEDLDTVVGGASSDWNTVINFVSAIPFLGPILSGGIKVGLDIANGKTGNKMMADITGIAVGTLADALTSGFGSTGLGELAKWGVHSLVGMGKVGGYTALDKIFE